MTFIATFYSHFGAMRFKKKCQASGIAAEVMPVPRSLSSSCGSCVSFEIDTPEYEVEDPYEEIEQVVRVDGNQYFQIYKAKN